MPVRRIATPRPGFEDESDDNKSDEEYFRPKSNYNYFWLANAACLLSHAISGGGQVVGKISGTRAQPLFFYVIRSAASSLFFFATAAFFRDSRHVSLAIPRCDWCQVILTSVGMFVGQAFYIVGLKLSSAIDASVWQPSQPLFTLLFAIAMGMEAPTFRKVSGVFLAFAAVSFLTVSEYLSSSDSSTKATAYVHVLFFCNCMGTPVQTLAMKPLLKKYSTPLVLAWCYSLAGLLHLGGATYFNSSQELLDIMCPPPTQSCGNGWEVDLSAVGGLIYFVVFNGILAYWLNAWASKHVDGSNVSGYAVMQPVTAACLSFLVIKVTSPPHYYLRMPTQVHLVASIGIFAGLMLMVSDSDTKGDSTAPAVKASKSKSK
jgi:drug/metabolite transporter (DMT)-like permease